MAQAGVCTHLVSVFLWSACTCVRSELMLERESGMREERERERTDRERTGEAREESSVSVCIGMHVYVCACVWLRLGGVCIHVCRAVDVCVRVCVRPHTAPFLGRSLPPASSGLPAFDGHAAGALDGL